MTTPWPLVVLMAVLGLAVGSFLNVVAYRLPRHESLAFPASHCPSCATPIKRRHNVPVLGWVILGGRCAACSQRISVRYPLVEAATGALFAAIALGTGLVPVLPALLAVATAGITAVLLATTRTAH